MATTTLTPTSPTPETPKVIKKAVVGENKAPASPAQTTFGCQHVQSLLSAAREQASNGYTRIIHSLRNDTNFSGHIHKSGDGLNAKLETTYLCLQCPNVSRSSERHRKDHLFAVESNKGYVHCHECKDFVYDPTFEEIRSGNGKKRKHSALQADGESKRLIANNTAATPCAATGLRGLYNMGQTCFMSVILQSIIHNPLVRTYYLSEGHRSQYCEREACTSCALDDIFTEYFGQEKHEGYGAVHMLQGCWKGGGNMAGYSQQDAHEYLGFILNSLHVANTATDDEETSGGTGKDSFTSNNNCDCIVHQTFGGMLKSTVTCSSCNTSTPTLDPFMDLSLDVRSAAVSVKKQKLNNANSKLTNGSAPAKDSSVAPMDLSECLDRFTSAETLSSDSYHCKTCASSQTATKKLSLTRLPPVVPIHLKRFSHSKSLSQSSKVETKIRFPFALDLTPYSAASSSKSKAGADNKKGGKLANGDATKPWMHEGSSPPKAVYDLSSVIVHKGKIDNGHYISYSRQGDDWFRFDDSMVVQVDLKEVLGAEAYMLFYVVREMALGNGDET